MKKRTASDDFEKVFSTNLRICRDKKSYTQRQVSKSTSIPLPIIIKMEEGKFEGKWRYALFMKIAAFYGYKVTELASQDFVFEHRLPLNLSCL